MHDGTVRDMCFIEDMSNKSSLLVSGGAGDCKVYVTDCATGNPFQALNGHSGVHPWHGFVPHGTNDWLFSLSIGHILTLYTWGGAMFISGSQDKTVRMWDLRTRGCVNMITPLTTPGSSVNKVAWEKFLTLRECSWTSLIAITPIGIPCSIGSCWSVGSSPCVRPWRFVLRIVRYSGQSYYPKFQTSFGWCPLRPFFAVCILSSDWWLWQQISLDWLTGISLNSSLQTHPCCHYRVFQLI